MDVIVTATNLALDTAATPGTIHNESTGTTGAKAPTTSVKTDDLVSRILKLVPGEVAAGYTALLAVVPSTATSSSVKYAGPTAILVCSILIVMLIRQAGETHNPPVKPHPTQYVVSVLAFAAWAISIRNPLDGWGLEVPTWITGFAIVLLPIFGGLLLRDRPPRPRGKK